jgi:hypothetical protein
MSQAVLREPVKLQIPSLAGHGAARIWVCIEKSRTSVKLKNALRKFIPGYSMCAGLCFAISLLNIALFTISCLL